MALDDTSPLSSFPCHHVQTSRRSWRRLFLGYHGILFMTIALFALDWKQVDGFRPHANACQRKPRASERKVTTRQTYFSFGGIRHGTVPSFQPYSSPAFLVSPNKESSGEDTKMTDNDLERQKGVLVLLTVPMAWGTFEPAVRFVYDIQPDIPPFVFQFVYYVIAASSLVLLSVIFPTGHDLGDLKSLQSSTTGRGEERKTPSRAPAFSVSSNTVKPSALHSFIHSLSHKMLPLQGGLELGTYLFLGNGLQVVGLKTVPSDRAAFLLQLTTIFVPLVQSLLANSAATIPMRTWFACFVALGGVACIGLDSAGDGALNIAVGSSQHDSTTALSNLVTKSHGLVTFSLGDFYIVLAALFYTFHCIRLEAYARKTPPLPLAAAKASTETFWCLVVILCCLFAASTGGDNVSTALLQAPLHTPSSIWDAAESSGKNIFEYAKTLQLSLKDPKFDPALWATFVAATTWTGLITIAYTITAQSFGQSRVKPATANLIYTIQPFFTALVAFLVLGERLGVSGYIGGVLIGAAVLVVVAGEDIVSTDKMAA